MVTGFLLDGVIICKNYSGVFARHDGLPVTRLVAHHNEHNELSVWSKPTVEVINSFTVVMSCSDCMNYKTSK